MPAKTKRRPGEGSFEMAAQEKQRRFAREYCIDFNGAAAARRAGYSAKAARVQAARLLTYANVRNEMERCLKEYEEGRIARMARLRHELELIGFANPADAFNSDMELLPKARMPEEIWRAIASVKVRHVIKGKGKGKKTLEEVEVRFWDKGRSLVSLGRMDGAFLDKLASTDPGNKPPAAERLTNEQILARLDVILGPALEAHYAQIGQPQGGPGPSLGESGGANLEADGVPAASQDGRGRRVA